MQKERILRGKENKKIVEYSTLRMQFWKKIIEIQRNYIIFLQDLSRQDTKKTRFFSRNRKKTLKKSRICRQNYSH